MMNFSTLKGLTIPEGNVTQITDASGRVLWAVSGGGTVILEVEKVKANTYANETTYTGEQFILLDIYPKTNGTVNVTYGGLTKTITDTSGAVSPNAIQVVFGTFNGVSDEVETPASGTLTIEGSFRQFGVGSYKINGESKNNSSYCGCVTAITDWGGVTDIPANAFRNCIYLYGRSPFVFPEGMLTIGMSAFYYEIKSSGGSVLSNTIVLPSTITSINSKAFCFGQDATGGTNFTYRARVWYVTILATTPPTTTNDVFGDETYYPIITVPKGCGEAYKAATGWSKYADKIVEAE